MTCGLLFLALVGAASAAKSDRATTSVGAQGIISPPTDDVAGLNLLLAHRLRWTLVEGDQATTKALINGRFTFDPLQDVVLERTRVNALGVSIAGEQTTWNLGRSAVYRGGPRLVDGVQLAHRLDGGWEIGAWGGEAPDLFTTLPAPRFGGGPILVYAQPTVQASIVGEALVDSAGALDRAGALMQARYSALPRMEIDSRLDLQLPSGGASPLSDGLIFFRWTPREALRLDAFYNAYAAPWYLTSAERDPALQRWSQRSEALGLTEDIPQDSVDPTLHQLVGAGGRVDTSERVRLGLDLRYRYHADPDRQFGRATPKLTLRGLADDRLELTADVTLLYANLDPRGEVGVAGWFEPSPDGVAFDSAVRLLYAQVDGVAMPGFYADSYVDWIHVDGWVVAAGVFATGDFDDAFGDAPFLDAAYGAIGRLSWRVRGD